MADIPEDLLEQIKELERLFTVDQPKLKEITSHFVNELTKGEHSSDMFWGCALLTRLQGLTVEGGSIVSQPSPHQPLSSTDVATPSQ